jgi:Domain of Unknown Function (DUF1080)
MLNLNQKLMKKSFFIICQLLFFLVGNVSTSAQKKTNSKDWVSIFNGKDLSGWDIKIADRPLNDNYKNTVRVEDGMMRIMYDQYENFDEKYGHIYFKKPYSYYMLRFEYRFQGNQTLGGALWNNRNSGVMVHSQSAESMTFEQTFPVSLEMQLLGGLGKGERHTGNLCSPGTKVVVKDRLRLDHCIESTSKTYDGDQWVKAAIIVLGDSIVHQIIEGDTVLTYEKTQIGGGFISAEENWTVSKIKDPSDWKKKDGVPLKEGYIAMQAESHPIDFKNIEILELVGCTNSKALNYKSYFVKSDNSKCKFKKK